MKGEMKNSLVVHQLGLKLPTAGSQVWSLGRVTRACMLHCLAGRGDGNGGHWLGIHRIWGMGNYWIKTMEISALIHLELQWAPLLLTYKVTSFWFSFISQDSSRAMTNSSSCFTTHSPLYPPWTLSVILGTSLGRHTQKSRTVVYRLFNCLQNFEKLQTLHIF